MATVRYMVKDVAEAKAFYIDHLGFSQLVVTLRDGHWGIQARSSFAP